MDDQISSMTPDRPLGRPRRTYDPKLADEVQCRLAGSQMSLQGLSTPLGISAATLSRSLSSSSFSAMVAEKLRGWLKHNGF